jgi:beta-galactosidase
MPTHRRPFDIGRFLFGFPHYPEQQTAEERAADLDLIPAAGANVVRMAEFAWDRIEPEPGRFDFSLFDETIAHLHERGVETILCTPTATPPPWMSIMFPDLARVDDRGVPQQHGSRQHASLAHLGFRERCRLIVAAMVDHFRDPPGVIGWQTDNELNTQFSADHSASARHAFRSWLADRYGTVDALNDAWGNAFWSQTARSFDEVLTPIEMQPAAANPSAVLDYRRFLCWLTADFQHDQVELIRAANSDWFVFHNVGLPEAADYRGLFGDDLDALAYDVYPFLVDFDPGTRSRTQRRVIDSMRAWTGNLIVPEHQVGQSGWPFFETDRPEPGEIRRMTWVSIASGVDGILYFRWRSARFGPEIHWEGVVDHSGRTDHRIEEIRSIKREIDVVSPLIVGTWVHVDAAVSGADRMNIDASASFSYGIPAPSTFADAVHDVLVDRGWQAGYVHPSDDLSDVRLYVIPHWAIIDPAWIAPLTHWVEGGGTLVIGARTGVRDDRNHALTTPPPGPLADLAGVCVAEAGRQHARGRAHRFDLAGSDVRARQWYERLEPTAGTEVLAQWTTRHLLGTPAITRRRIGTGSAVYVGTFLERPVIETVLEALETNGVRSSYGRPAEGVVRTIRRNDEVDLYFYVNGSDQAVVVTPPAGGVVLVGVQAHDTVIELSANDVAIVHVSRRA